MTVNYSPSEKHLPVLLQESIEALAIRPDGTYVDGTFGRGGHSRAILSHLNETGRLIALDRDPRAYAVGQALAETDSRFHILHRPFSELKQALNAIHIQQVDGILLDIGVSSPQLDTPERGFSFRFEAPLDMRMDTSQGLSVAEWLTDASEKEITQVIFEYGEERYARHIARAICAQTLRPQTTSALANLISNIVRKFEPGQHPATRTFQAFRIYINQELEELKSVLPQAISLLKPQGRLAVISFHSLEDRIVKLYFQNEARPDKDIPKNLPLTITQLPQPKIKLIGKARRASESELRENPRARSATLRTIERTSVL